MQDSNYLIPKKNEFVDLILVSFVLGFLFSYSFFRFTLEQSGFFEVLLSFFLFIFFLLFSRLIFMKFVALRNAFEIDMRLTYFDRFGYRVWDKTSHYVDKKGFKGIPVLVLSVFGYFLTLGFFIFPAVWNYTIKKIPHLFLGSKQKYESEAGFPSTMEISNFRYSKALFAGFVFYFVFGTFMKLFLNSINQDFYNWFTFILYWFAFWTIIPIFGSEGYELFWRNRLAWIAVITILILGMLALLIFNSLFYVILVSLFAIILVLFVMFKKYVLSY
ncbi:MAG: hypothetical protein KC550_02595 [Nanoarchaeota archaeon]|nr:hypothetical protein [Nanoarchaeota archaeon]